MSSSADVCAWRIEYIIFCVQYSVFGISTTILLFGVYKKALSKYKMSDCSICNNKLSDKVHNKISCNDCKDVCHAACDSFMKEDSDYIVAEKQTWHCLPCSKSRMKSMAEASYSEPSEGADFTQIISMLNETAADCKWIEAEISKSFDFVHERINEQNPTLKAQDEKLKEYLRLIYTLRIENNALKKNVADLETKIDENELYMRSNTLEVHGVPENKSEDVHELVKRVGVALDVNISDEDIDTCHLLGKKAGSGGPVGIFVKLVRHDVKSKLLERSRVRRNLNKTDIGFQQPASPVYLNESLTYATSRIFAAAHPKKEKNFIYLWVRSGKIFMRKNQDNPIIVVNSMDQFNSLN